MRVKWPTAWPQTKSKIIGFRLEDTNSNTNSEFVELCNNNLMNYSGKQSGEMEDRSTLN